MQQAAQPRPRVEGDREDEILDATLDLLLEVGYDRLTMDAVARRARASKATLYRRWDGKPSLVVDAMVRAKQAPSIERARHRLPARRPGQHLLRSARDRSQRRDRRPGLRDHRPGQRPRVRRALPRGVHRAQGRGVPGRSTARAVERGEIAPDIDIDIIAPALAGILLHRSFVLGLVPDDDTVQRVIDHVILPAVGCTASPRHPDSRPPPRPPPARPTQKARTS